MALKSKNDPPEVTASPGESFEQPAVPSNKVRITCNKPKGFTMPLSSGKLFSVPKDGTVTLDLDNPAPMDHYAVLSAQALVDEIKKHPAYFRGQVKVEAC